MRETAAEFGEADVDHMYRLKYTESLVKSRLLCSREIRSIRSALIFAACKTVLAPRAARFAAEQGADLPLDEFILRQDEESGLDHAAISPARP